MRRRSLIAICAMLLGCTSERQAPPADGTGYSYLSQEPSVAARGVPTPGEEGEAEASVSDVERVSTIRLPAAATNMIIRTATASLEVDSLEPAVEQLNALATRFNGFVGGSGIETGRNQLRKAFIEVKVPAAHFQDVLTGLKPIGKLEAENVKADDVGAEFVDINARMDNARRLERRLLDLLATRTGKLTDVLEVEQSLARVREEIERYQGRLRYLEAHTAMSTLNVTLHEPVPVVGTAGKSVMGEAFAQAWRNFVALLSVTVQALGVILPLGLVGGLVWFVTRRLKLRSARAA